MVNSTNYENHHYVPISSIFPFLGPNMDWVLSPQCSCQRTREQRGQFKTNGENCLRCPEVRIDKYNGTGLLVKAKHGSLINASILNFHSVYVS